MNDRQDNLLSSPLLSSPFHSAQVLGMSILDVSTALIWLEMDGALYRAPVCNKYGVRYNSRYVDCLLWTAIISYYYILYDTELDRLGMGYVFIATTRTH